MLTALVLAALAGPGTGPAAVPRAGSGSVPAADPSVVHGMTISCQTWGWEWGSPGFAAELDRLAALGVNWIAIHPYAGIRASGEVPWRPFDAAVPPDWLVSPIREVHARGMHLLIKPHLAYWGSPFRWRGDIDFEDPGARARFFEQYRRWIVELARATRDADAFAVGTELDLLTGHQEEWRRIIAEVREVTAARLTFASNWTHFESVPFWDALDAVGVQAYFPLSEAAQPTDADLRQGWALFLPRLRAVAERTGKPVVFTELGYDSTLDAAREPWVGRRRGTPDSAAALDLQSRCLRVSLEVLEQERSWLRGAFLWKWFVGEASRENYRLDDPRLHEVIQGAWQVAR